MHSKLMDWVGYVTRWCRLQQVNGTLIDWLIAYHSICYPTKLLIYTQSLVRIVRDLNPLWSCIISRSILDLWVELGTNRDLTAAVRLGNHENAVEVWDCPNCGLLGHIQKPHLVNCGPRVDRGLTNRPNSWEPMNYIFYADHNTWIV
jgi:hypothetical protein